ncbi:MAG: DNA primase [Tissierellia bacterium]|nr:DNA primase [Tissierellia bacterium]
MAYKINEELIEKIKDTVNIVDLVSRYVNLKPAGSNYVGLCPFHQEKTPSFTVSESKNLFHCFGCGEGGDLISFVMKIENLSFIESIKLLADMYNIPIESYDNSYSQETKKEKERLYEINREAALFYIYNLRRNPKALKYLKERNIGQDTMIKFGLGYASNSWNELYDYLKNKGYEDGDIEKVGLISKRKDNTGYYDKFRNRIMFPIVDNKNRIIGFGGRILDVGKPKYLNSPDTIIFEKGKNLYGINLVHKMPNREKIILVEGYMDVISLFAYGINYSVASLGTAFTQDQAKLLKRYSKNIYICYDSDNAGIKATLKALDILEREDVEPKVIILPKDFDPDDFIKEKGLDEFKKLEENALSSIDYRIYILKKKYNLNKVEEKIRFTKEAAKLLRALKSPIEKDVYIDKISKETNIAREAIGKEVFGNSYKPNTTIYKDKYISGKNRHNKSEISPVKAVLEPAHLKAEKNLLKLMIQNIDYYKRIKNHLSREDFLNYECKILVNIIYDEYENNPYLKELDINLILGKLKNEENIDYEIIDEITNIHIVAEDIYKFIEDSINTVKYFKLKFERKIVANKIKELDLKKQKNKGDVEELKRLCLKLTELDKELKTHL